MGFPGGASGKKKKPPANAGRHKRPTWALSLGREDPVEKGMATHSSILAWRESRGQKSLAGYSPQGHTEWAMTKVT